MRLEQLHLGEFSEFQNGLDDLVNDFLRSHRDLDSFNPSAANEEIVANLRNMASSLSNDLTAFRISFDQLSAQWKEGQSKWQAIKQRLDNLRWVKDTRLAPKIQDFVSKVKALLDNNDDGSGGGVNPPDQKPGGSSGSPVTVPNNPSPKPLNPGSAKPIPASEEKSRKLALHYIHDFGFKSFEEFQHWAETVKGYAVSSGFKSRYEKLRPPGINLD